MKLLLNYLYKSCIYAVVWYLRLCLFATCGAQPLRIHLVAHSHDDAGWLKTVDQYYTGSEQQIQKAGVEYVIDSVVQCLGEHQDRTFSFGEIAFFSRWWERQTTDTQSKVWLCICHCMASCCSKIQFNCLWRRHCKGLVHAGHTRVFTRSHTSHTILRHMFRFSFLLCLTCIDSLYCRSKTWSAEAS